MKRRQGTQEAGLTEVFCRNGPPEWPMAPGAPLEGRALPMGVKCPEVPGHMLALLAVT